MKPEDKFIMSDQERESPLWKRIKSHYEKRLSVLRSRNDGPLGADETLQLRGRIHEVKSFLSIEEARPIQPQKR